MHVYKQKLNKIITVSCFVLLGICLAALVFCVIGIANARITVDYVSNAFLILVNAVIILFLSSFLFFSQYRFTDKELLIKTAFFKDVLDYSKISRILYFATEEELYIEMGHSEDNVIKINLHGNALSSFTHELKQRLPLIPYEVSLKLDDDLE